MSKRQNPEKYKLWPSIYGTYASQSSDECYNWKDYLDKSGFDAVPVFNFPHAPLKNEFRIICPGVKCEVPNVYYWEQAVSIGGVYWVATIIKLAGYKALMRYDGFGDDPSQDFWMNICSSDLHHVGWCVAEGKPLVAPKPLTDRPPQQQSVVDWKAFLVKKLTGSKILPSNFQDLVKESIGCSFRLGNVVEAIDRNSMDRYRLGVVKRIVGRRLCVEYVAIDQEAVDVARRVKSTDPAQLAVHKSIWCHCASPFVKPYGWCFKIGAPLYCSPGYVAEYERKCKNLSYDSNDATEICFPRPAVKRNDDFGVYGSLLNFTLDMKLEAIDVYNNYFSIAAATVTRLYKYGAMEITYDGNGGSFALLVDQDSPFIFPVGYSESLGIDLEPPEGYAKSFDWKSYLKETNALGAPDALFNRSTENAFVVGQKLEATDNVDPHLVCVATVVEVKGRLVRIHYDGWGDGYDQWFDASSPELFPIGWCEMVGYALEQPVGDMGGGESSALPANQSKSGKKAKKRKSAECI